MNANYNYVDQVTLKYLMNKDQYKKYIDTQKEIKINKKEQKFYKKRIISLTKGFLEERSEKKSTDCDLSLNLLNDIGEKVNDTTASTPNSNSTPNPAPNPIPMDVKYAFENYVRVCIDHFKSDDKTDILQSDYVTQLIECSELSNDLITDASNNIMEEADKLLMRSIQIKQNTLDQFVKRTKVKPKTPPILPKKRDVNLKDPALKTKGLKKE